MDAISKGPDNVPLYSVLKVQSNGLIFSSKCAGDLKRISIEFVSVRLYDYVKNTQVRCQYFSIVQVLLLYKY